MSVDYNDFLLTISNKIYKAYDLAITQRLIICIYTFIKRENDENSFVDKKLPR